MITPFMLVNLIYLALESTAYALAFIVPAVNLNFSATSKFIWCVDQWPPIRCGLRMLLLALSRQHQEFCRCSGS